MESMPEQYDGDGSWAVRIREHGADPSGWARGGWVGNYRKADARAVATRIAAERGGRVVQGEGLCLYVVVGSRGGRPGIDAGKPGIRVDVRLPRSLIDRLDAHAAATGTTRSELLRRGGEMVLAEAT